MCFIWKVVAAERSIHYRFIKREVDLRLDNRAQDFQPSFRLLTIYVFFFERIEHIYPVHHFPECGDFRIKSRRRPEHDKE